MKTSLWASALCLVSSLSSAAARKVNSFPKPPGVRAYDHPANATNYGVGTFDQPVDHFDPSKGTFSNRFWFDTTYYKGSGSPVFLFMPGESDASDYLGYMDESTLPGLYAKLFGGMVVLLERMCPLPCVACVWKTD